MQPIPPADLPRGRPLFLTPVRAGFPSPAEDYIDASLDLHAFMVRRPASTFFVRCAGDSMIGAGLFPGDILVVDRAVSPRPGQVVVAVVEGEFTVKRFTRAHGAVLLQPENPRYAPIVVTPGMACEIWGVVTYVVHDPNRAR